MNDRPVRSFSIDHLVLVAARADCHDVGDRIVLGIVFVHVQVIHAGRKAEITQIPATGIVVARARDELAATSLVVGDFNRVGTFLGGGKPHGIRKLLFMLFDLNIAR